MAQPLTSRPPKGEPLPLVLDSPHSGNVYPDDFGYVCDYLTLRQGEDAFVDELFGAAPEIGATLIAADFPRTYIDPNRNLADIDQALLDAPWPGPVEVSQKTEQGIGLVWRKALGGADIYDRKLSVAEVQARIDNYHTPYHAAVADAVEAAFAAHGGVWHINCHSMPSVLSRPPYDGLRTPEFCLGDLDGTTCDPAFRDLIADSLRRRGYQVAVNNPYKGVEIVRRLGRPGENRHSIQIEINRGLYMDELAITRADRFGKLCDDLTGLLEDLADYIRAQTVTARAADD